MEVFCFGFQPQKVHITLCPYFEGEIVFKVHPKWSPLGVERIREMVDAGFFEDKESGGIAMFRTVPGFVSQFGIHGDPKVQLCLFD